MQQIQATALMKGIWPHAPAGLAVNAVVTHSAQVQPGCVFVAIKGQRVDGHSYAAKALKDGAAFVLLQRPVPGLAQGKAVQVPSVLNALVQMAGNYRSAFSPLLLAVTGSVGKTTTKDFCAAIFSSFGETVKTQGNQNNEIGMPNTLFTLSNTTRYAVVEMGMQAQGEIGLLSCAARPGGAIITRIDAAHMQQLGSMENIVKAKMEVCEGLAQGAPLVLNGDDEWLQNLKIPGGVNAIYAGVQNPRCPVRAVNIRASGNGLAFLISDEEYGEVEAYIPTRARHNISNALLAYTAATRLGLNAQRAAAALAAWQPDALRQSIEEKNGITVIKDYYNAGPQSMQAALNTLGETPASGRRIALLGDMLELGAASAAAHTKLGNIAKEVGVNLIITVGAQAAQAAAQAARLGLHVHICNNNAQAVAFLQKQLLPGDVLLLKASRGLHFEEIVQALWPGNDTNTKL